jgi:hypothetical protein
LVRNLKPLPNFKPFCLRPKRPSLSLHLKIATVLNFQFSTLSEKKNSASGRSQKTKEKVYGDRLFSLFFILFIPIGRVYTKRKKMSTR